LMDEKEAASIAREALKSKEDMEKLLNGELDQIIVGESSDSQIDNEGNPLPEFFFQVQVRDSSGTYNRGFTSDPIAWTIEDLKEGWYEEDQPFAEITFKVKLKSK
jgi:hypothetical protein